MIHAAFAILPLATVLGVATALPTGATPTAAPPPPPPAAAPAGPAVAALDDDAVDMDIRANLSLNDGGASVWLDVTIATSAPGARTWTDKEPLLLPLLAPIVRDVVMDRGVMSKATKQIEVETTAAVKTAPTAAGLAMTGVLRAGTPITLRIKYPLSVAGDRVDLGVRGAVGRTAVSVATVARRPVRVRLAADRPARIAEHEDGRERLAGASLVHPLRRGEVATIRVLDLPVQAAWPGRLLRGAAVFMAIFAFAVALRNRGRS